MAAPVLLKENKHFGGATRRYRHASAACACDMTFSVFVPPSALDGGPPAPVLIFLSGLTCTDANATEKGGAQRAAAAARVALAFPDTSPRGPGVPDDPAGGWDFGLGAGFYVDAAVPPFDSHYRMEAYVTADLPAALASVPGLDATRLALAGHSMGGHGALTLALKHPSLFRSASALAPICAPARCPWGVKALTGYLGRDVAAADGSGRAWDRADATRLAAAYAGPPRHLLVDVGTADEFLEEQLLPGALEDAVRGRGGWVGAESDGAPPAGAAAPLSLTLTRRPGYDHSYFFISTFIDAHVRHAAQALLKEAE